MSPSQFIAHQQRRRMMKWKKKHPGETPPANLGTGPSFSLAPPDHPDPFQPDADTTPYVCDTAAHTDMPDEWAQFGEVPSTDELEVEAIRDLFGELPSTDELQVEAIKDLESKWLRFKKPDPPAEPLSNYSSSLLTRDLFESKTFLGMRAILEINEDTFKTVLESDWWKEEPQFHPYVIDVLQRAVEQAMSDVNRAVDSLEREAQELRMRPPYLP